MQEPHILVVGASGQLGIVLTQALQKRYGEKNVIATDIREPSDFTGHFEKLDARNYEQLDEIVVDYGITQIYHLAAILSANGEKNPIGSWDLNMQILLNVLEVSRLRNVEKVFYPSSIAVFGEDVNRLDCQQDSVLKPTTVYGISKAAGENWANYYFTKYGLDVRSLRYPGVIGYQSMPGGGTTDYAVDIFYKAVSEEPFECFLSENTKLPMIYMEDAINATIQLMEAPAENISVRTSYNLAGMTFSPAEIATEIKKHYPAFEITYEPDFRQDIAASWPEVINDKAAHNDWNWQPDYDLVSLTTDMISNIKKKQLIISE